jgi:Tfp pilus assembly protein PilP
MRALVFSFVILLAGPAAALAQGDAAMAAARAVTGSTVGQESAKAAPAPATPASTPAPAAAASAAGKTAGTAATPATGASAEATGTAGQPQGFSYNPEGRRDPFVNLLRRGSGIDISSHTGARPAGIKGLGAAEVTLKGTLASQGSYVGILQGADARTYVVHPGERLFDGTIRSITADSMVIIQQVNDPLSKETQREVRKVLRQTEEAR